MNDDSAWGPQIPHTWGHICPFPDEIMRVRLGNDFWLAPAQAKQLCWDATEMACAPITAYILRADHHAYGPRRSRFDQDPDIWSNAYDCEHMIHRGRDCETRGAADSVPRESYGRNLRIGIWRIFLKPRIRFTTAHNR